MPWFGRRHEWAPPEPSCAFVVRAVALELPSIDDVVRPDGAGGAFPGVPQSKTRDESAVRRPLEPGDELSILSPDEAVVDVAIAEAEALRMPDEIRELMGLDAEMVHRVERARFELGLQLREPGRSVPEAVVYATDLAHRIAEATTGVVQDIHSFRTLPPTSRPREEPAEVDVRDHVVIHAVPEKGGSTAWLHTHGLVKFGRPEVEVYAVPADRTEHVAAGLNDIGQYFVQGALIRPGETLGDPAAPILAREGRRERGHWGKTPVLELVDVDDRGRPAKAGAMWGMEAWFALADQRPPK